MTEGFSQRLASDPVAVTTLVLALITVAAIVVPLVAARLADRAERRSARRQILALLDAIVELLEQQMREPAWRAGGGMDVVAPRLLDERLLRALTGEVATAVTGACAMAYRVLCATDIIDKALREQNVGLFEQIRSSAQVSKDRIVDVRGKVAALGI